MYYIYNILKNLNIKKYFHIFLKIEYISFIFFCILIFNFNMHSYNKNYNYNYLYLLHVMQKYN